MEPAGQLNNAELPLLPEVPHVLAVLQHLGVPEPVCCEAKLRYGPVPHGSGCHIGGSTAVHVVSFGQL